MPHVTLTTVLDEGTAEMFADALGEQGIEAEVRRQGANPYLGAATPASFEVRVSTEQLDAAKEALKHIEESISSEAADSIPEPDEPSPTQPAARSPKLWMVIPLGLLLPVPVGCLYARFTRLGYALLGTGFVAGAVALLTHHLGVFYLALALKAIDFVLAPLLLSIENRRQGRGDGRLLPGFALSALLVVLCVGGFELWNWQREIDRQSEESFALLKKASERINWGLPVSDDPARPLRFPDLPIGHIHGRIVEYMQQNRERATKVMEYYELQMEAWTHPDAPTPSANWLKARRTQAEKACELVQAHIDAPDHLLEVLHSLGDYDARARSFLLSFESGFSNSQAMMDRRELLPLIKKQCQTWEERAILLEKYSGHYFLYGQDLWPGDGTLTDSIANEHRQLVERGIDLDRKIKVLQERSQRPR